MFACCHPSLAPEASVALTLRLVAGLTVEEIARALLSTPPAISQRLVRAKRTLREGRVSVDVPADHELPERLGAVLAVVYLVFNEGHAATAGDQPDPRRVVRRGDPPRARARAADARRERGARAAGALPRDRRAAGGALRRATGSYVTLEEHDRSLYDAAAAAEADELVRGTLAQGPGPTRCRRRSRRCTRSRRASPRPTGSRSPRSTRCSRARTPRRSSRSTARSRLSFARGPEAALPLLDELAGQLSGYASFHAALADVQRRCGDEAAARAAYRRALELTDNPGEREFLERRIEQLGM